MRIPRTFIVGVAAVVIGCFVTAPAPSTAQEPQKNSDPRDERIAQLERRIEQLSADNARLKKERDDARTALRKRLAERPMRLIPPLPQPLLPAVPSIPGIAGESVPPNWSPREFNGIRYYVIPLADDPQGITK